MNTAWILTTGPATPEKYGSILPLVGGRDVPDNGWMFSSAGQAKSHVTDFWVGMINARDLSSWHLTAECEAALLRCELMPRGPG